MWFKNLRLYRFNKTFNIDEATLQSQLEQKLFAPCGKHDLQTLGWSSPLGKIGEQPFHYCNGFYLLNLTKQEKMLPASVIKEFLNDKVEEIEEKEMRQVLRKEKDALKDQIILELLPRAFCRTQHTQGYIDLKEQLLILNVSSDKKAEEFLGLLRQCLGSLPVVPLQLKDTPSITMTEWVKTHHLPVDLIIEDETELKDNGEDGGVIRCKGQDLSSEEITAHIDSGKQVGKLALSWNSHLSFVLQDDLSIKRLRFGDDILEESKQNRQEEDLIARFEADFTLMTLELSRFFPVLFDFFGGQDVEAMKIQN